MRGFIIGTIATAITFAIVAYLLPQIDYGDNLTGLIIVAVIAGVVNGVIKPIIKLFGCFFYIITLGLFALFVNAMLFLLVEWLADLIDLPFRVDGFWSAFWGAIIVSFVSWGINVAIPDPQPAK